MVYVMGTIASGTLNGNLHRGLPFQKHVAFPTVEQWILY